MTDFVSKCRIRVENGMFRSTSNSSSVYSGMAREKNSFTQTCILVGSLILIVIAFALSAAGLFSPSWQVVDIREFRAEHHVCCLLLLLTVQDCFYFYFDLPLSARPMARLHKSRTTPSHRRTRVQWWPAVTLYIQIRLLCKSGKYSLNSIRITCNYSTKAGRSHNEWSGTKN